MQSKCPLPSFLWAGWSYMLPVSQDHCEASGDSRWMKCFVNLKILHMLIIIFILMEWDKGKERVGTMQSLHKFFVNSGWKHFFWGGADVGREATVRRSRGGEAGLREGWLPIEEERGWRKRLNGHLCFSLIYQKVPGNAFQSELMQFARNTLGSWV